MLVNQIILGFLIIVSIGLFYIAFKYHNNKKAPPIKQDYYGKLFLEAERPYVSSNPWCNHTGDKSLVVVASVINCETVHTVCDDCGQTLKVEHDCR